MWRELEGEIIVLDSANWTYLGVNESGAALWPLVVEGASRAQLVDHLATRYEISAEAAGRDVQAFVDSLAELGLVHDGQSAS